MRRIKAFFVVVILAAILSAVSVQPNAAHSQTLTARAEIEAVGGDDCANAWGLGLSLAAASLSPCSIVCAALAWYDLLVIAAYC